MPRKTSVKPLQSEAKERPASSPEARENRMISLAIDLAERQLREGTASSQVITHYLRLATTKERLEEELLELQRELVAAKTEAIQSEKDIKRLYADAMNAFRKYSGTEETEEDY